MLSALFSYQLYDGQQKWPLLSRIACELRAGYVNIASFEVMCERGLIFFLSTDYIIMELGI